MNTQTQEKTQKFEQFRSELQEIFEGPLKDDFKKLAVTNCHKANLLVYSSETVDIPCYAGLELAVPESIYDKYLFKFQLVDMLQKIPWLKVLDTSKMALPDQTIITLELDRRDVGASPADERSIPGFSDIETVFYQAILPDLQYWYVGYCDSHSYDFSLGGGTMQGIQLIKNVIYIPDEYWVSFVQGLSLLAERESLWVEATAGLSGNVKLSWEKTDLSACLTNASWEQVARIEKMEDEAENERTNKLLTTEKDVRLTPQKSGRVHHIGSFPLQFRRGFSSRALLIVAAVAAAFLILVNLVLQNGLDSVTFIIGPWIFIVLPLSSVFAYRQLKRTKKSETVANEMSTPPEKNTPEGTSSALTEINRIWVETVALHKELDQKVLSTEMDWDMVFNYPALTDPTIPEVAELYRAQHTAATVGAELPRTIKTVKDALQSDFYQAVQNYQLAWSIAFRAAQQIAHTGLSPEDAKKAREIRSLTQKLELQATDLEKELYVKRIRALAYSLDFTKSVTPEVFSNLENRIAQAITAH